MADEDDGSEQSEETIEEFDPKVRWVIPARLNAITFVGRDVLAVAHDLYVVFLQLRTGLETVYVADGPERGDGVDVVAGYKTHMWAFAEKVKHARIFIVNYPSFQIMGELKDMDVNRYKGLCLLEGELVAGFTGFPNYLVTVWSWRTGQRLLALPTGVIRRDQIYMASRSTNLVCECYHEGLVVWEVAPCYRRCYMMRRDKRPSGDWDVADPPLVAIAWSNEGQLYALDSDAKLYSMASDGIRIVSCEEWNGEMTGSNKPHMCAFGNGLLIYGPDRNFRWLKKVEVAAGAVGTKSKWHVAWVHALDAPADELERLVGSAGADTAAAWTRAGRVLRIVPAAAPALPAAPAPAPAPAATVDDRVDLQLFTYKQRNITKVKLIAPAYKHVVTMNQTGEICIYELLTARMVLRKQIGGTDQAFQTSPAEPLLALVGARGDNYGLGLFLWRTDTPEGSLAGEESLATETEQATEQAAEEGGGGGGEAEEEPPGPELLPVASACLTHQQVSRVVFSPSGRELIAAAMAAGHLFIYHVSEDYKLTLVRYTELGRGLADCFLMKVGQFMRAFALVLFSDKYVIGERIVCINAVTGKDNKFAGKMQGPYSRLLPLSTKDTMLAVPHLSRHYHVLNLNGEKGVTVSVKMGPIIDSGHDLKQFSGVRAPAALLTFGADGAVLLRRPDAPPEPEFKLIVSHRYERGVRYAAVDAANRTVVHVAATGTAAVTYRNGARPELAAELRHAPPPPHLFREDDDPIRIFNENEKNYLDLQEEKKVHEEALDYKKQREEVVRLFEQLRGQLVELLEENIQERPLHQLSLSEFNLHLENKKIRLKQAEREREEIRLTTEARIRAQDKVTAWIKATCWDSMLTARVKVFAIFSHYQVENYPVLPTQRDQWPELQQTAAYRALEMENDDDVFRPWEERLEAASAARVGEGAGAAGGESTQSLEQGGGGGGGGGSEQQRELVEAEEAPEGEPYVLSGSSAHKYVTVPPYMIPQTLAFSFLQMNWLHQIVKRNVQSMRLWFNKQFDELMTQKKREVGLVGERNARLRFILEELNKLSDLRGSFHHLLIVIKDPEWRQEEQPIKLTKVEVEECKIPPYSSKIVVIPPELGPKDDFRERALNEMMDGVLEKLWHEEIKKPIPKPQCMLDKEPENFNEEDLRQVFDYEAKVKFRNEERDKYRKMLHAEYAKLSQVLNENIVKFNMRVKDLWLTKLKVDSVIGQENLNLMRLRRMNLDRLESAEELEVLRVQVVRSEGELEALQAELAQAHEQSAQCQAAYEALAARDRQMDRTFKNHFADFAPIIVEQCYKFFKKRPKWHQRASMIPVVLNDLAAAVATGARPPLLHPDCLDYLRAVEQLDLPSNMPTVLDEGLWTNMCKLRRAKIENEIRMRALVQESAFVDSTTTTWMRAVQARRTFLAQSSARLQLHRDRERDEAVNRSLQLVLPAGQVEIVTTGHMEDFDDAALVPREDIDVINNLILRVGAIKLRLMRRQIEFRKGILAKEWEHAQMKMKLRHMQQELYTYGRLKIPKELQRFLKNKEKGFTDENDYQLLEKEMAATKMTIERVLQDSAAHAEELQVKISKVDAAANRLEGLIGNLHLKVSEKRLNEDPLEPIRIRRIFKRRMETLVARGELIREVQANHTRIVLLQTELELLRLKTYPTLASFRTLC